MYSNLTGAIYIAQPQIRLFEGAHHWVKLLQIAKIWFGWWTSPKSLQFM